MSDDLEVISMLPGPAAYDAALQLARFACEQTGREFDVAKILPNVVAMLNADNMQGFIVRRNGRLIGGLLAGIQTQWWSGETLAYDVDFVLMERSFKTFRRLLMAYLEWAQEVGADRILLGVTGESAAAAPVERIDKLYRYFRFDRVGGVYQWAQQQL